MSERLFFPATERNREPILAVLKRVLPGRGTVLEVASGSGEHAVFFAAALPTLTWQPSDPDPAHRASITAWTVHQRLENVLPPLPIDAAIRPWALNGPGDGLDAIYCANMIHIAPWEAAVGLLAEAGRLLRPGGPLVLYGPFQRGGQHTAPSNVDFDASLRSRNPAWGVRDLDEVAAVAAPEGLTLDEVIPMPANNLTVVLRRGPRSGAR